MTTTTRQTTTIPATENESWGFWGCLEQHAADAWPLAMTKIAEATGEDLEAVRAFLDSRHGRHFGDDVLNALDAGANALVTAPSVPFRGQHPPLRRHFLHLGPGKPHPTLTRSPARTARPRQDGDPREL